MNALRYALLSFIYVADFRYEDFLRIFCKELKNRENYPFEILSKSVV